MPITIEWIPESKNIQDFLVQIVRNRSQEGFAAAFMGGVMTMEEISQCNAMRALKDAVTKLVPGSVEYAAALHALEIIKSCLKLNGRDTEKFLKKAIPCRIRYLDYNFCDQQAVMTEQMHAVVRQIQQSQSDLQVHNKTLSAAVTSLYEFTENPSCDASFQHTATMLEEAVATAEVEQHALLDNAVSITTKMNSLYL